MRLFSQLFLIFCLTILLSLSSAVPAYAQSGTTHVVRVGESLSLIAQNYGVTTAALAEANGITNYNIVRLGQRLTIPGSSTATQTATATQTTTAPQATYTKPLDSGMTAFVREGDTLSKIAARYGVTTQALMQHNGISNPNMVYLGQKLSIPVRTASDISTATGGLVHVVKAGDTISSIAALYGVAPEYLMQSNGLTNANIVWRGQKLRIYGATKTLGPRLPPAKINGGARIIDVNLSTQHLTAWDGNSIFMDTSISSGNPWTPTVTGRYLVNRKYTQQHMSGPGYDIEDVPWVMYFWKGYAFHGAYWHNNFGEPMSHGCIHLTPTQAQQLYDWAHMGTEVYIHY
ncbi:MAG: LysM peptidoglycan-binding domain-containing protein [Chloroflexota bacterium]